MTEYLCGAWVCIDTPDMIWLLILLQEILSVTAFAADGNSYFSRSAYFKTQENKRLAGHFVKQFETPSLMSCSQSCLRKSLKRKRKLWTEQTRDRSYQRRHRAYWSIRRYNFPTFLKVGTILPINHLQRQNKRNSITSESARRSSVA